MDDVDEHRPPRSLERSYQANRSADEVRVKLLLTTQEAAHLLGMSRTVIYRLITHEQLFSVKIGGARRIPLQAVHAYVARLIATGE